MKSVAALSIVSGILLSPAPGLADGKIRIRYDIYSERIRPEPAKVITSSHDQTIEFTGENTMNQSKVANYGSRTETETGSGKLGSTAELSGNTYGWKVGGPNKLTYHLSAPQNDIIASIVVTGKTCVFKMVNRLKPGFKEYLQWSTELKANATYSVFQYSNLSCTIE